MITFDGLGRHGRLGNQMFQYASLRGIAAHHGYAFCIPQHSAVHDEWTDHQLFDAFELCGLKHVGVLDNCPIIRESCFHFDERLFVQCPDNVGLYGCFQTYKYFLNIEQQIREDFTFKEPILSDSTRYKKYISSGDVISLHVRRGDYILPPANKIYFQHGIDYYKLAISKIPDIPVIIFSEDIDWCKRQDLFNSSRFIFCENIESSCKYKNHLELCLMSLCKYHIIANSTFSWWGAWLSNGSVIAPPYWFGTNPSVWSQKDDFCYVCKKRNITDIIPESWEIAAYC